MVHVLRRFCVVRCVLSLWWLVWGCSGDAQRSNRPAFATGCNTARVEFTYSLGRYCFEPTWLPRPILLNDTLEWAVMVYLNSQELHTGWFVRAYRCLPSKQQSAYLTDLVLPIFEHNYTRPGWKVALGCFRAPSNTF